MNTWLANIKSDDIDGGLADNFDGSLSGLGSELGANTYNMSEALLALPSVFKQENGSRLKSGSSRSESSKQTSSLLQDQFSSISSPSLTLTLGKGSPLSLQNDLTMSSVHSLSLPSLQQHGDTLDHMNSEWVNLMTSMKLQEVDDNENRFQYVLCAATSPATRLTEETLTYLNQGQSYEIKLKQLKDAGDAEEHALKSIVRVVFHERRLQYMEKEQLEVWKLTRPGERIVDIDIPLSKGLLDVKIEPHRLNCVEFVWDPSFETSVFVKVHCISTEFTAKKHGGEKGVPFRIQVETYSQSIVENPILLHCASCQVKVFKPKGADRKNKTDREKIERRSAAEKSKYQPSYECTVLTEIPLEQVHNYLELLHRQQDEDERRNVESASELSISPSIIANSLITEPVLEQPQLQISLMPDQENVLNSITESVSINQTKTSATVSATISVTCSGAVSTNVTTASRKRPSETCLSTCMTAVSPTQLPSEVDESLSSAATPDEVSQWLESHRFQAFVNTFQNFSGSDLLRLYRDDLIQICGLADGIRLFNTLKARSVRPMLTLYVCQASNGSGQSKPVSWDLPQPSPLSSRSSTPSPTPPLSFGKYDIPAIQPLSVTSCAAACVVWSSGVPSPSGGFLETKGDPIMSPMFSSQKRQMPEKEEDSGAETLTMFKKQRMQSLELASREVYQALYLDSLTERCLAAKIAALYAVLPTQIQEILVHVPSGIYVLVTDLVVQNMKDNSRYFIEAVESENRLGSYRVMFKCVDNF